MYFVHNVFLLLIKYYLIVLYWVTSVVMVCHCKSAARLSSFGHMRDLGTSAAYKTAARTAESVSQQEWTLVGVYRARLTLCPLPGHLELMTLTDPSC